MPPRKSQDGQGRILGPAGRHSFARELPHPIELPYPLPKPANAPMWYAACANIVAAYNAGFQAAARGAYGLPPVTEETHGPVYRTVAVETSKATADATVAKHWAGPEWDVRVRCVTEHTWAVDVAAADVPPTPIRKRQRARSAFERAA